MFSATPCDAQSAPFQCEDHVLVEKLEKKLSDMRTMGPGNWDMLHTAAAAVVTEEDFDHWLWLLHTRLKWMRCRECKNEFTAYVERNPPEPYCEKKDVSGRIVGPMVWMMNFHNCVNYRLNTVQRSHGEQETHYILEAHQYMELYASAKVCETACGSEH